MATAKQRIADLTVTIATKMSELHTNKEEVSNKQSDLTSTSANDYPNVPAVKAGLDEKVDKVTGKGLSTNDYTTTEKNKLAGIEAGAEKNVQSDWNASSGDALIKNKPASFPPSTHSHPISQVNGLQGALDDKEDDLGNPTSNGQMLVSTTAGVRSWITLPDGVTTYAGLTDKATVSLPTINTPLKNALANKVDKVTGKGLSTNDYTTAEKNKLASLESSKYRGLYTSEAALPTTGNSAGSYADVDSGQGSPTKRYIWDSNDSEWQEQVGASTQLTAAQIKQLYESNANTNAFTDSFKTNVTTNTTHRGLKNNPHDVTKAQVGLGNVDNTKDVDKPVSTAQAAADAAIQQDLDSFRTNHVGTNFPDYSAQLIAALNF